MDENGKKIIEIKDIRKVYKMGKEKVIALHGVNLDIYEGEVITISGTSGSGKSTLLHIMAGLEKPTKGTVTIGRHEITKFGEDKLALFRRKYTGFIFQSFHLLSNLTALENVMLPLVFQGKPKYKRQKAAAKMLAAVGLEERLKHKPTEMSGGQQQRVSIARAFVNKPPIVIADEPTGNLDSNTTIEVLDLITKMARQNKQTLIVVSHDTEIWEYSDRVVHMKDGKIISIESGGKKHA